MGAPHPQELIARIQALWIDPKNTAEMVGKGVGLSFDAVKKIASRRRRTQGRELWPDKSPAWVPNHPDTIEAVKRLWAGCEHSAADIGAELGLTTNRVIGIVHRGRAREGMGEWRDR